MGFRDDLFECVVGFQQCHQIVISIPLTVRLRFQLGCWGSLYLTLFFFFFGKSFFARKVMLKPRTSKGSVQNVSLFFFFFGKSFFARKVMLKPRTSKGSVQNVSIIWVFWKVIAENCLLAEIWMVCVSQRRFLSAKAFAISSSFNNFVLSFFSLSSVCWIPFIDVVTAFVSLVTIFQGS